MSCDEDFLNHDFEDINDHDTTSIEEVHMDVNHECLQQIENLLDCNH